MARELSELERGWLAGLIAECGARSVRRAIAAARKEPAHAEAEEAARCREVLAALSPRQREVLTYYARGRQAKETARLLGTAVATVKCQLLDARQKAGVQTRSQASDLIAKAALQ